MPFGTFLNLAGNRKGVEAENEAEKGSEANGTKLRITRDGVTS